MQVRKIISSLKPEIKAFGDVNILFIKGTQYAPGITDYKVDAVVIEHKGAISSIRKNNALYLKPLFINGAEKYNTDGCFDPANPSICINKIQKLNVSIQPFIDLDLPEEPTEQIVVKLLRYLISRGKDLTPQTSRQSSIGYNYAFLEDITIESNRLNLIKIMNKFSDENLFKKTVIDKVNLCYECEGGYLNFTECCTKCNNVDLKSENLIHHFRCAYIGPESDFNKQGQLVCPKCDQLLKHIGIDYDKPSEIHTCNNCSHASQETKMKAKCVDCNKENELDQLTTHKIYAYKVTEKGREKAIIQSNKYELKQTVNEHIQKVSTPYGIYKLIRKHELSKENVYTSDLFELTITIDKSITDTISDSLILGLLEELCSIIKPYLKSHDILTVNSANQIVCFLIDYTEGLAKEIEDIILYNLNKMLKDNGWSKSDVIQGYLQKAI